MAERPTIRIQHGFCSLCRLPVRLQWILSDDPSLIEDKDGYWKIIDHASCSQNNKKGESAKGAGIAYKQMLIDGKVSAITKKRWPPNPVAVREKATQLSLFW